MTEHYHDPVNHPRHYTSHPSGVECIDLIEALPANLSHAVGYLWRAGEKDDELRDLKKARWYVTRELLRIEVDNRLYGSLAATRRYTNYPDGIDIDRIASEYIYHRGAAIKLLAQATSSEALNDALTHIELEIQRLERARNAVDESQPWPHNHVTELTEWENDLLSQDERAQRETLA